MQRLPVILGVTGASGAIYGVRLLQFFLDNDFPVELVYSENAKQVALYELGLDLRGMDAAELQLAISKHLQLSDEQKQLLHVWDAKNIAASISSGSYKTQGMIIAPASMGTIANIANGTSNNLVARAADVVIKEKRRLILIARETPLSTIHLRNMLSLSELGATILPAAPGFYQQPKTIDDQVDFVLGKCLDSFGVDHEIFKRWSYQS